MHRILLFALLTAGAAEAGPWFDGSPQFVDDASRELAGELLAAHGGMAPMREAESLQFNFFTKTVGGPFPFYSFEAVDLESGNAYMEWPFWESKVGFTGTHLWSHRWPMPMPAGFFVRLTTSFITLPWQINADSANVGPSRTGRLPQDDTVYDMLRVTFDERSPTIPGTYYELYIDRDTHLMKAIRFDINHPGMVANPTQPIGPNIHVFDEYKSVGGAMLPTFYFTYGTGSANGGDTNAYHFAWNLSLDKPFDHSLLDAPDGAQADDVSLDWWGTGTDPKGARQ